MPPDDHIFAYYLQMVQNRRPATGQRITYETYDPPPNMKNCAFCRKTFVFTGNKAKYCPGCKIIVRRKKTGTVPEKIC